MINVSAKIKDRITAGLKKFQPILAKAQAADVNESDTVTIITDMLCEIFGYDKYENITSEFAIKKTYCDLAIKLQDRVPLLIECKAIALNLKDDYVRQATNYAADAGIEWVILTTGVLWRVYHISFGKPIEREMVYEFNMCELSAKKQSDLEMLYYLCIESFSQNSKATLEDLRAQKQILNRFIVAQVILTDTGIDGVRKCLRKLYPDFKVTNDEIRSVIYNEVFKREVLESDEAEVARKAVVKQEKKMTAAGKTKQSAAKDQA